MLAFRPALRQGRARLDRVLFPSRCWSRFAGQSGKRRRKVSVPMSPPRWARGLNGGSKNAEKYKVLSGCAGLPVGGAGRRFVEKIRHL